MLKTREPDNCCSLHDKSIVSIENFIKVKENLFIIGREFISTENFFEVPCESSYVNVFKVSMLSNLKIWPSDEVAYKNVKIVFQGENVVIPLLHCEN